ncbi:MAG: DEAD/DEAH box helicase, partial [Oligoflexia bacterium]|nr:DEAD/DEAH box helicase [Oligoflexia bacterium]
ALQGRNILGSAQTGTGKTLAYMIPIVTGLTNNPGSIAIILTPTRELASQVRDAWNDLTGMDIKLKTALLIGGQPMPRQCDQLQKSPRLIVGTPGRVNDHLKRKTLKLDQARFFVLDETDRMLDMGFSEQIQRIERYIPKKRQTFMFSATFPDNILSLAKKYLTDPVRISIGEVSKPVERIRQEVIKTSTSDKFPFLLKELDHREGSIIIFVKTKHGAKNLANKLYRENHSVDAIHGNLHQPKRDRVLREFRTSRKRILVATDVAARGLDIPHVMHVINYDIPQCADDYIHRIGRTGRAGAEGNALCFVSSMDTQKWSRIYKSVNF